MHHRLFPAEHKFSYKVFMFYLDLQEDLSHLKLFSKNKFNWFSFFDKDHSDLSEFLKSKNIEWNGRATLLTNVRTLGHVFNPVSFYFCFDGNNKPVCAVAEVTNTHKERKLYLLDGSCFDNDTFRLRTPKHFYVSPFSDLDTEFEFIFRLPSSSMQMRVDDYKQGKRILLSALTGMRKEITDARLFWYGLKFPLITVKIITLIYWQALKLKLKGLPSWKKKENMHLQKDYVNI
ncbi:MAG: DUF1365 domain-containing protein [Bacteroidota bacterium]